MQQRMLTEQRAGRRRGRRDNTIAAAISGLSCTEFLQQMVPAQESGG